MRIHLIKNGVTESRITKIHHGVSIPHLFGLKRREITFLGAPEERKGIHTILDALKILKGRNVNIRVSIYGLYSDSERKITESHAASKGVNESLVWGGRLTEIEFDKKLQQSLFTIAAYSSPISGSNVVTRAMSNATPVIASDIGGLKEYLGGGGIMIAPRDPYGLADAIELLLENAETRQDLGLKGRERALNLFSWEKIAEKTVALYESILATNQTSRK
jgi:glycosyltransferase involved in cell wall biosynthesis